MARYFATDCVLWQPAQTPDDTIRPGESPEAAAFREAGEETGLSDFEIVRKLGESEYDISPYRFEVQRRHFFHLGLTEPTPERWDSQEDHDGDQEPTRFECFWIPLEAAHVLQSGQGALLRSAVSASAGRRARLTVTAQSSTPVTQRSFVLQGPVRVGRCPYPLGLPDHGPHQARPRIPGVRRDASPAGLIQSRTAAHA
ncbi:NUDIX domain-containing protein [Streptomyces sp. NPDC017454]